jgi:hypothetical protein
VGRPGALQTGADGSSIPLADEDEPKVMMALQQSSNEPTLTYSADTLRSIRALLSLMALHCDAAGNEAELEAELEKAVVHGMAEIEAEIEAELENALEREMARMQLAELDHEVDVMAHS